MPNFLGCIITHPTHKEGVVIFEEDASNEDWRVLLIAFAKHTEEIIPERLAERGFVVTGERVELPATYRRLPGHDAVEGWGIGLMEAREALGKVMVVA